MRHLNYETIGRILYTIQCIQCKTSSSSANWVRGWPDDPDDVHQTGRRLNASQLNLPNPLIQDAHLHYRDDHLPFSRECAMCNLLQALAGVWDFRVAFNHLGSRPLKHLSRRGSNFLLMWQVSSRVSWQLSPSTSAWTLWVNFSQILSVWPDGI